MDLIFLLVLNLALFAHCLVGSNITVGTSLKPGELWVSSGGTFAIGMVQAANDNTSLKWSLSIWYQNVLAGRRTFLWTATNSAGPVQVSGNDTLLSLKNGGLYLGDQMVSSNSCKECTVQYASMLENGNFVLVSNNGSYMWESFNSPTDTLVPGQEFAGVNKMLSSGRFKLLLKRNSVDLENEDFPPSASNNIAYWSMYNQSFNWSDTVHKKPRLDISQNGVVTFTDDSGYTSANNIQYTNDYKKASVLRRLVLDSNGNLKIYSLSAKNDSWNIVWQAVIRECDIYGTCGTFGICSYSPTASCNCPPGFSATANLSTNGANLTSTNDPVCIRNLPMECGAGSAKFVQLVRADYLYNDLDAVVGPLSMEECKSMCLNDCDCLAAAYKLSGNGNCYLKGQEGKKTKGYLYNGRQGQEQDTVIFLKVSNSSEDPTTSNLVVSPLYVTNTTSTYMHPILQTITKPIFNVTNVLVQSYFARRMHLAVVVIASGEFLVFVSGCIFLWRNWQKEKRKLMQKYTMDIEGAPVKFSFKELQTATNSFSLELGSGSFGHVYRGMLPDGRIIAVKQLEGAVQGERQFKAEVSTIGKIHHVNLVRLLGYCAEENHRLLVLEYMPNGSLERFLFSPEDKSNFFCDWDKRYSIALGIARGITYLHEECHECILHCDIKPQNILLDNEFCPKVSDFGLAKLVSRERPFSVTTIAGTRGYLAPEWISNLQITSKVDVYSFGMVLLEILSGRDNFRFTQSAIQNGQWFFPSWAFKMFVEGNLLKIADPKLSSLGAAGVTDWEQFERMLRVAFWCIKRDMNIRPSMSKVVQMLEGNIEVPTPPSLQEDMDSTTYSTN